MNARYQNLTEIDRGGQARIFLADDVLLSRKVILKTVKHNNEGSRRRLQREARVLREEADNLHTVNLLEKHFECSSPYIVLEYCAGGSIEKWIFDRKPVRDVVLAIQHVLVGLRPVHEKGGFHGDVTPRNLQIAFNSNNRWSIKLIDFGLAQTPNPESGSMTRGFRGTPKYIAPEVQQGDDYTSRSDICSLGFIFRELLTGSTTKPLFTFNPPPAELSKLIDEMTAEDPLQRPDTAHVYQRLQRYMNKPVPEPTEFQLPALLPGKGWGWLLLAAAGTAAILAANANSYDDNMGRWRDSHGRFRSGMYS